MLALSVGGGVSSVCDTTSVSKKDCLLWDESGVLFVG